MNGLIAGNVYRHRDIQGANKLYQELKIFPTPFKGIYYVPYDSERNGWYVTDPHLVLYKATRLYLETDEYYFGLYTALYFNRVIWNAMGADIVNPKISRKIGRKLPSKSYWRGEVVNKIMSGYPFPIRLHRIRNFDLGGTVKRGSVVFSDVEKTRADADYLCRKGDKTGCEVLKLLKKPVR